MRCYFYVKEGEDMQENNLKGLWIPYEILTNGNLNDKEKYIYSLSKYIHSFLENLWGEPH